MLYFAVFALVAASAFAESSSQIYSYSLPVGSGSGTPYTINGEGRITAVRVWESSYVRGFQFRYGYIWSAVVGYKTGQVQEIELYDGEAIIQISGTHAHYIYSVVFTTTRGRTLSAGSNTGRLFNMYPSHSEAELRIISGNIHGAITSIAAHWAVVDTPPYAIEN
ncbi:zymogen granule membrane protein 16-like [Cottoperca gobio]|uniref:Zymogen granule membrane protein 16-like n=1 Tax=Cottoperca gobio TaxID=56716 RepID=A0A6J2QQG2_COTGO|nr:zymogen granule membrane protein 16-like [Cottoperca gobio]